MGVKDQELIEYLEDSIRFADLMNGTLFQGNQIVKPEYLQREPRKKRLLLETQNTEHVQGGVKYLERERDILMLHGEPEQKFYLACEGQSCPDYEMPVRCFTYDAVEYSNQVKKPRDLKKFREKKSTIEPPLLPVFHQILYLGEKRWLSKHTLREMMHVPEKLMKYAGSLPDYQINVIDIHEQNPELFHTEWKDIFLLMQNSRKKEKLRAYIEKNRDEIQKLSGETRRFMAVLLEQYEIMENGKVEVKDMCEAWDGAMMMYREEGRLEGKSEGKLEGMQEAVRNIVQNMLKRGVPDSDIRVLTECEQGLIDAVKKECSVLNV